MANDDLPFRRIYVDLPSATAKRLEVKAREARTPMKVYLARLIEADQDTSAKPRSKVNL